MHHVTMMFTMFIIISPKEKIEMIFNWFHNFNIWDMAIRISIKI
jgi:hypothetical protein